MRTRDECETPTSGAVRKGTPIIKQPILQERNSYLLWLQPFEMASARHTPSWRLNNSSPEKRRWSYIPFHSHHIAVLKLTNNVGGFERIIITQMDIEKPSLSVNPITTSLQDISTMSDKHSFDQMITLEDRQNVLTTPNLFRARICFPLSRSMWASGFGATQTPKARPPEPE